MTTSSSYSSVVTNSTSSTASSTVIDINHPYYIHPSDNPGMTLINLTLNESNYLQWSRSMEIALSSKMQLGFIDGTCSKPVDNSVLAHHWIRCNHMVTSWLLNAVSVEIQNSVVYLSSTKLIWDDLAVRYAQSNMPRIFNLRQELSQLHQGSLSIASYFTKHKTLVDELDCLVSKPKCSCNKCECHINTKLDSYEQTAQLTQFLMGLGDQYTAIRGQILLMTPLPTLSQCYSILMQEENQREVHHSTGMNSSTLALSVKHNGVSRTSNNNSDKFTTAAGQQSNFSAKRPSQNSSVVCDYCQLTGHSKDKCFCLVGYPPWHKLYGKPKPKPKFATAKMSSAAQVTNVGTTILPDSASQDTCGFSETQYSQLVERIQRSMQSNTLSDSSQAVNQAFWPGTPSANSVHFAGPFMEEGTRDW